MVLFQRKLDSTVDITKAGKDTLSSSPSASASLGQSDRPDAQESETDELDEGAGLEPSLNTKSSSGGGGGGGGGGAINEHQMVVYHPANELQRSLSVWVNDANTLIHSPELAGFLSSTRDVAFHTGALAVHIACLPITFPIHVVSSASNMVVGSCVHVASSSLAVIDRTLNPTNGQDTASYSPIDGVVHNVVPLVCRAANRIKDDVGGICLGLLSPFWGRPESETATQSTSAGESSSEQENFLDRLRLDYPSIGDAGAAPQITNSDVSKYLLRVIDLGLDTDDGKRLFYIDLSPGFANKATTKNALDLLRMYGIALAASNDSTNNISHLIPHFVRRPRIQWKTESSTGKLLQKKENVSLDKWLSLLQSNVLVWSGRFTNNDDPKTPLFLSRGIVPGSPKDILDLLWDNSRTNEYNQYCMGRTTQLVIEEEDGQGRGAKVVKSETKVPFTGFSVEMSTLMHARELEGIGYMIVSRSLRSGVAGSHFDEQLVEGSATSELVWGVNIMRSVPGMPNRCDLTSVSQVNSALVPNFLKFRVGLNAVSDCFQALRNRNSASVE